MSAKTRAAVVISAGLIAAAVIFWCVRQSSPSVEAILGEDSELVVHINSTPDALDRLDNLFDGELRRRIGASAFAKVESACQLITDGSCRLAISFPDLSIARAFLVLQDVDWLVLRAAFAIHNPTALPSSHPQQHSETPDSIFLIELPSMPTLFAKEVGNHLVIALDQLPLLEIDRRLSERPTPYSTPWSTPLITPWPRDGDVNLRLKRKTIANLAERLLLTLPIKKMFAGPAYAQVRNAIESWFTDDWAILKIDIQRDAVLVRTDEVVAGSPSLPRADSLKDAESLDTRNTWDRENIVPDTYSLYTQSLSPVEKKSLEALLGAALGDEGLARATSAAASGPISFEMGVGLRLLGGQRCFIALKDTSVSLLRKAVTGIKAQHNDEKGTLKIESPDLGPMSPSALLTLKPNVSSLGGLFRSLIGWEGIHIAMGYQNGVTYMTRDTSPEKAIQTLQRASTAGATKHRVSHLQRGDLLFSLAPRRLFAPLKRPEELHKIPRDSIEVGLTPGKSLDFYLPQSLLSEITRLLTASL